MYSLLPDFFTLNFIGPPGVEEEDEDEDEDEEDEGGALAAAAAATFLPAALAAAEELGAEALGAAELEADELVLILFRRTRKHSRLDGTGLEIKLTECATPFEVEDEQPDTL